MIRIGDPFWRVRHELDLAPALKDTAPRKILVLTKFDRGDVACGHLLCHCVLLAPANQLHEGPIVGVDVGISL